MNGIKTNGTPSITRQLCEFACSAQITQSSEFSKLLEDLIIDYIGLSSYAAKNLDSSPVFIKAVSNMSAKGPGTTVGLPYKLQAQYAAMLNGTMVHSMDCDDTNSIASLHPGAPVISALFAQIELESSNGRKITGKEFYDALAVGYEVTCRIGKEISDVLHRVGFHPTGVVGAFGATAAAGRIAGLNVDQMEAAFGIVDSMASGSMQFLANGSWNKRFHPGIAAHNALLSVQFALAGMVGASLSLEGDFGLFNAYGRGESDGAHLNDNLGKEWVASYTAIKPYPCCRLIHAPIDAIQKLRSQFKTHSKDVSIELLVSRKAELITGKPFPNKIEPQNIVEGQFSVYYHVAVAWLKGHNDWTAYKYIKDNDVEYLTKRITVKVDKDIPEPSLRTVIKIDGKSATIDFPLGEPENPVTSENLEEKFMPLATDVYGKNKALQIIKDARNLWNNSNMAEFISTLGATH